MYYIDFDNTICETGKMTKDILNNFSKIISSLKNISFEEVLTNLEKSFNSSTSNFDSFIFEIAQKYEIPSKALEEGYHNIIFNLKNYIFPDALEFIKKLKSSGEKICILTYVSQEKNLSQQALKLAYSGVLPYVDEVYITAKKKFELEINYENGIFIDDNPSDLEGLYNSGARKLIRIKKPNNEKRTSIDLNLPIEVPVYNDFLFW